MDIIVKEKISKTGNPYIALCAVTERGREILLSYQEQTILKVLPNDIGYKDITEKPIKIGEIDE